MQLPEEYEAGEAIKARDLARMKRFATGLLIIATLVYAVAAVFADLHVAIGFVAATAEAAMVGALADWFAVTALFRHPLRLPIPHTAIIPRRKDGIADQFGDFVQHNFLSDDVIIGRIREMNLARQVAEWLAKEANAREVADQVAIALGGLLEVVQDDDVQGMIERRLRERIRDAKLAPLLGDLLGFVTSGERLDEIIRAGIHIGHSLLDDSRWVIREKITQQTPWWFPDSVDRAIYYRIMDTARDYLAELEADPDHPMRERIHETIEGFLDDLKNSPEMSTREQALKTEFLEQPAVRDFAVSLWRDVKASLARQVEKPDAELKRACTDAVMRFGNTVLADADLATKLNTWTENSIRHLIESYGHEVADLIARTIRDWDPDHTATRIELQIGRDLQFIRINGTVVGGLAGLTIHTVSTLFLGSGTAWRDAAIAWFTAG